MNPSESRPKWVLGNARQAGSFLDVPAHPSRQRRRPEPAPAPSAHRQAAPRSALRPPRARPRSCAAPTRTPLGSRGSRWCGGGARPGVSAAAPAGPGRAPEPAAGEEGDARVSRGGARVSRGGVRAARARRRVDTRLALTARSARQLEQRSCSGAGPHLPVQRALGVAGQAAGVDRGKGAVWLLLLGLSVDLHAVLARLVACTRGEERMVIKRS